MVGGEQHDFQLAPKAIVNSVVMAGLVPAIHVLPAGPPQRRGCPAQGRA
jgi:hypothetical protein